MAIERIDKGGEIVLTRDLSVPNINGTSEGSFTLGDMRDFIQEVEIHGGVDNTRVLTSVDSGSCMRMLVRTEGGVVPSTPQQKVAMPFMMNGIRVMAATSLFWILVLLIGVIF